MRSWIAVGIAMLILLFSPIAVHAADECKLDRSEFVYSQTPTGPLKAYVFSPAEKAAEPRPAILIFHGGGWVVGEPSWAFGLVERYACKGIVTIVPQYRLSDRKTASPAEAMDDAMAAFQWARKNALTFNLDQNRVAALGWSAGAHLAASAAVFGKEKAQRPDLLALVSPAVSVVNDKHFRALFPPAIEIEQFSPAEHVGPSLPPTIIVTGRTDTVTPLASVQKFHDRMIAAGNASELNIYDGVGHLFTPAGQPDDGFPKPDRAIRDRAYTAIDEFLIKWAYRKK